MKKKQSKGLVWFSVLFYAVTAALLGVGTVYDLQLDLAVYQPNSTPAMLVEYYGQFVSWATWGIGFAVIFVCRRDLNENLALFSRFVPQLHPVKNTDSGVYKTFNFLVKAITTVGFFVLCGVGWKKLIENVVKNILLQAGRENFGQGIYFAVSFAVAAVSILLVSKLDRRILQKLEALAAAAVVFGILIKIVEALKPLSERVRFREMVAWSNGFVNEEGLSEGRHSPLTREMAAGADFSAFTPWYKKGDDMGIYNRADSFPSGHTLHACAAFLSVLLCSAFEKLKKLTPFALCVSVVYVYAMGFSRLVVGAHYLTDVTAAALIGYTLFLVVRRVYMFFTEKTLPQRVGR